MQTNDSSGTPFDSLVETVQARDPRKYRFGYFGSDAPPMAAVGIFHWFSSLEEMIEFMIVVEPSIHFSKDEPEYQEIKTAIQEAARRAEPLTSESVKIQVGSAIEGLTNLEWVGSYDNLLSGSDEFAKEVREEFYSNTLDDYDDESDMGATPIPAASEDAFVEFLSTYRL